MTAVLVAVLLSSGCVLLAWPTIRFRALMGTQRADSGHVRDAPKIADPALMLDLVGSMFAAGSPPAHALQVLAGVCVPGVAQALLRVTGALLLGADWPGAWRFAATPEPAARHALVELHSALAFTGATGAPSAEIIHARAEQLRRRQNQDQEKKAAALGVRLVVPLGLCSLPAFVCLGVVPVLLALLPGL